MNIPKKKKSDEYGTQIDLKGCIGIKNKISYFIFKYIIIACGCVGITEIVTSSFGIQIDRVMVYKQSLILLLLLPLFEYIWARIPIYIALFVYVSDWCSVNEKLIKTAVKGLMNIVYPIVCQTFNFPNVDGFDNIVANGIYEINTVATLLFLLLVVFMAVLIKYRLAVLVGIVCAAPVCFCIFMGADVNPLLFMPLLICISGTLFLKKGRGKITIFRRKYSKKIKITNFSYEIALPVAVCLFALVFAGGEKVVTPEKYAEKVQVTDTEKTMKRTVTDVASIWFSDYKKNDQAASADGGQLAFFTSMKITDDTVMRLRLVPFTESDIYLRAYVGSVYKYNENKWEHIAEEKNYIEQAQAELENSEFDKIEIAVYGERNKLFDSYNSTSDDIVYNSDDDFAFVNEDTGDYELDIHNVGYNSSEYKDFVYNNYLQLPEENRAVIDEIAANQGFADNEELLGNIQNYLNDNFDFTYNAEVTPFGKDYVNTFLTETKSGNFVHYATAATLIYRSLGIPARYVSGYHIPYEMIMGSDDINDDTDGWITDNTIYPKIKNVNISNQSMYAWVEIYKDGEGWVPQDVCEKVFDELAEMSENAEDGQNSEENADSTEDKPKKEKKELFKTYFETAYSNDKTDEVKTKFKLFADDSVKKAVKFVKICLVTAVLAVLLWMLAGLLRFIFAKNNKKAEIIFRRLEKKTGINSGIRDISSELEKRGASEEDRAVLEKTIQKAMFSENGITDEEVKLLIKSYKNIGRKKNEN